MFLVVRGIPEKVNDVHLRGPWIWSVWPADDVGGLGPPRRGYPVCHRGGERAELTRQLKFFFRHPQRTVLPFRNIGRASEFVRDSRHAQIQKQPASESEVKDERVLLRCRAPA